MKNKINTIIVLVGIIAGTIYIPTVAYAETGARDYIGLVDNTKPTDDKEPTKSAAEEDPCENVITKDGQTCVDGVVTSVIKCDSNSSGNIEDSCVWSLLTQVINIMTAGIGLLAVGGVIYGSILYTTAGGSMDQTKQAIKIIQNVIIGLVAYAFMYSFLNYVIPGGLF